MKCPKCGHTERLPSLHDPIIFGSATPETAMSASEMLPGNPGWTAAELEGGLLAYTGPGQAEIRHRLAPDGTRLWWRALPQEDASDAP